MCEWVSWIRLDAQQEARGTLHAALGGRGVDRSPGAPPGAHNRRSASNLAGASIRLNAGRAFLRLAAISTDIPRQTCICIRVSHTYVPMPWHTYALVRLVGGGGCLQCIPVCCLLRVYCAHRRCLWVDGWVETNRHSVPGC